MTKSSEIKQIARNKLAGNWPKAFAITAIYIAINTTLSYISSFLENVTTAAPILFYAAKIVFALIFLPISFGYISSMVKFVNDKTPGYTEFINDALLNCSKAISIFIRVLIKILIPSLIIVLAVVGLFIACYKFLPLNWDTLGGYVLLLVVLYVICTLAIAIISLPYALSNYALANDNKLSAKEAIEKSIALMDGNKWSLVKLLLSFIGWILLIGIVSGTIKSYAPAVLETLIDSIGSVFLLPYLISSIAVFYNELNDVKVEIVEHKTEK